MKIEAGKKYKVKDGIIWEILDIKNPYADDYPLIGVNLKTGWVESFSEVGRGVKSNSLLVEECKYPLKGKAWVNVYRVKSNNNIYILCYNLKENALNSAPPAADIIARIEVNWEEGEGL